MLRSIRARARRIYLDYAASTPSGAAALKAWKRATRTFANPSSIHADGLAAKGVLDSAREIVARVFRSRAEEVTFVSGGTEGLNIAIQGIARAAATRLFSEVHVVALATDHAAVTMTLARLEALGAHRVPVRIEYLPVDHRGLVDPAVVARALTATTALVALSRVNGELGVIQPTRDVSRAVAKWKEAHGRTERDFPYVVVDACQSPVVDTVDRQRLGADVVVVDSSKCYGVRGAGAMMKRRYVPMEPIVGGGGQEDGLRSGTPDVAAAASLAAALTECEDRRTHDVARMVKLRDTVMSGMISIAKEQGIDACANGYWTEGDVERRAAHIANVCVPGKSAEMLVLRLDARGFSCAHASACSSSGEDGSSPVVHAFRPDCASSSLRVSIGRATRPRHIRAFLRAFAEALPKC